MMHEKQEARREVRRMIANRVKCNWTFDFKRYKASTQQHQSPQQRRQYQHDRSTLKSQEGQGSLPKRCKGGNEVSEWRERYYGSSLSSSSSSLACMIDEFSSESESDSDATDDSKIDLMALSSSPSLSLSDRVTGEEGRRPVSLAEKKVPKKIRQIAREEEEACWNEGFALWRARRDAWTGAVMVCAGTEGGGGGEDWGLAGGNTSTVYRSRHSAKRTSEALNYRTDDEDEDEDGKYGHDCSSGNSASPEPSTAQSSLSRSSENSTTLVPVSKPLVSPTNAIRATITPAIYTEIYNTVILSGRSPSIPINLADMTRALVKGWQDNGEWPPKPGACAAEAPLVKKKDLAVMRSIASGGRHAHLKKGVESMRRVFGLGHEHGHNAVV